MSEVPLTLDELKTEFGKDMLLTALEMFGSANETTQRAVARASASHHIAAAEDWRKANQEKMQIVGTIANRALVELPGGVDNALMSIMSDLSKDLYGIRDILNISARYMGYLFGILMGQPKDDIEKCLTAIVAFGNGE